MNLTRERKIVSVLIVCLFLASVFIQTIMIGGEIGGEELKVKDIPEFSGKGVHIDIDFNNESYLGYDLVSILEDKKVRFNTDKNISSILSIEHDDISLSMKPVKIFEEHDEYNKKSNHLFGKDYDSGYSSTGGVKSNRIEVKNNKFYDVEYKATLSGVKETVVIRSPPQNISDDVVIRSVIDLGQKLLPGKNKVYMDKRIDVKNGLSIFNRADNKRIFRIPDTVMI